MIETSKKEPSLLLGHPLQHDQKEDAQDHVLGLELHQGPHLN